MSLSMNRSKVGVLHERVEVDLYTFECLKTETYVEDDVFWYGVSSWVGWCCKVRDAGLGVWET